MNDLQSADKDKEKDFEPLILAFACNWCSYPAADSAGLARMQYPPNFRIIRVMCGGRVNPGFIMRALELGADGVLYSCCHEQDCHYIFGAKQAVKNAEVAKQLAKLAGFEEERVRFERLLGGLGTLANAATLLGLLGTVVGLIQAFGNIAATGSGGGRGHRRRVDPHAIARHGRGAPPEGVRRSQRRRRRRARLHRARRGQCRRPARRAVAGRRAGRRRRLHAPHLPRQSLALRRPDGGHLRQNGQPTPLRRCGRLRPDSAHGRRDGR